MIIIPQHMSIHNTFRHKSFWNGLLILKMTSHHSWIKVYGFVCVRPVCPQCNVNMLLGKFFTCIIFIQKNNPLVAGVATFSSFACHFLLKCFHDKLFETCWQSYIYRFIVLYLHRCSTWAVHTVQSTSSRTSEKRAVYHSLRLSITIYFKVSSFSCFSKLQMIKTSWWKQWCPLYVFSE